jgi:hypothetical protein
MITGPVAAPARCGACPAPGRLSHQPQACTLGPRMNNTQSLHLEAVVVVRASVVRANRCVRDLVTRGSGERIAQVSELALVLHAVMAASRSRTRRLRGLAWTGLR